MLNALRKGESIWKKKVSAHKSQCRQKVWNWWEKREHRNFFLPSHFFMKKQIALNPKKIANINQCWNKRERMGKRKLISCSWNNLPSTIHIHPCAHLVVLYFRIIFPQLWTATKEVHRMESIHHYWWEAGYEDFNFLLNTKVEKHTQKASRVDDDDENKIWLKREIIGSLMMMMMMMMLFTQRININGFKLFT